MSQHVLFDNIHQVHMEWNPEPWKAPEDIEKEVNEFATKREAEARAKKETWFRGPLVRASEMKESDGILYVKAEPTDYAYHALTRDNEDLDRRANALYAAGVVTAKDERGCPHYVFGKSGATEAQWKGQLNVVAGSVHPEKDLLTLRPDVGSIRGNLLRTEPAMEAKVLSPGYCLLREMREEFLMPGYMGENVVQMEPRFVVRDEDHAHPSIMYVVPGVGRWNLFSLVESYPERADKERRAGRTPEFSELIAIPHEDMEKVLDAGDYQFHNRVEVLMRHHLAHHAE